MQGQRPCATRRRLRSVLRNSWSVRFKQSGLKCRARGPAPPFFLQACGEDTAAIPGEILPTCCHLINFADQVFDGEGFLQKGGVAVSDDFGDGVAGITRDEYYFQSGQ